jgi:transcriptional regulator with GAF, ATPase, and Fis domain
MTDKRFDGLFKTYSINEGYVTVSEKEIDDVIKQLNELHNKYVDEFALRETLQLELQRVEEENKELKKQVNDLQFNKSIGQREYQRRLSE